VPFIVAEYRGTFRSRSGSRTRQRRWRTEPRHVAEPLLEELAQDIEQ
jgi:hypothetical protein